MKKFFNINIFAGLFCGSYAALCLAVENIGLFAFTLCLSIINLIIGVFCQ